VLDTPDTRQILDVITAYGHALQEKNTEKVMALVSKDFFENSGTPAGDDDYDCEGLKKKLVDWTAKVVAVRADLEVKNIVVQGDAARAPFFFEVNYQLKGADGALVWKRENDTKEMHLRRESGVWRVTSGI
jgi:hypothetical protein